jgi:2'-5' RNA ligase
VALTRVERFDNAKRTIYLHPEAPELAALYERLVAEVPACASARAFSPHLTIAAYNDKEAAAASTATFDELRAGWTPLCARSPRMSA